MRDISVMKKGFLSIKKPLFIRGFYALFAFLPLETRPDIKKTSKNFASIFNEAKYPVLKTDFFILRKNVKHCRISGCFKEFISLLF